MPDVARRFYAALRTLTELHDADALDYCVAEAERMMLRAVCGLFCAAGSTDEQPQDCFKCELDCPHQEKMVHISSMPLNVRDTRRMPVV